MLQLFLCIGFYTWLMLISTYMAVVKQNNMNLFASIPFLMVILTLLIATPVYAEFRYAQIVTQEDLINFNFGKHPQNNRNCG